ncbi:MAG: hypothetical protein ACWA5X_08440 [bacterium]
MNFVRFSRALAIVLIGSATVAVGAHTLAPPPKHHPQSPPNVVFEFAPPSQGTSPMLQTVEFPMVIPPARRTDSTLDAPKNASSLTVTQASGLLTSPESRSTPDITPVGDTIKF